MDNIVNTCEPTTQFFPRGLAFPINLPPSLRLESQVYQSFAFLKKIVFNVFLKDILFRFFLLLPYLREYPAVCSLLECTFFSYCYIGNVHPHRSIELWSTCFHQDIRAPFVTFHEYLCILLSMSIWVAIRFAPFSMCWAGHSAPVSWKTTWT